MQQTLNVAITQSPPQHIAICICTAGRPLMLKDCLDSLLAQELPNGWVSTLIIIDNNSEPDQQVFVQSYAADHPSITFRYTHQQQSGIPFARNRALAESLEIGADWIAFIDDDELAEANWLNALIKGAEEFGCEIVTGEVNQIYPEDTRYPPPSTWDERGKPRGYIRSYAWTNNVMLHRSLIDGTTQALRFNESMRKTGGTDQEFFGRARAAGAVIRQIPEALVTESIPASRATLPYYLYRQLSTRSNASRLKILQYGTFKALPKLLVRAIRYFIRGLLKFLLLLPALLSTPRNRRQALTDCLIEFASAGGILLGLTPYRIRRYRTLHGS